MITARFSETGDEQTKKFQSVLPHTRYNVALKAGAYNPCFPYPFGMERTTMKASLHTNVNMNDE